MTRPTVRALACCVLAAGGPAQAIAATRVDVTELVTLPEEPRAWTFTATSDAGRIIGFNFDSSNGSGFGIHGIFNQVNPFGQPTIMNDLPEVIYTAAGSSSLADTHFLVTSGSGLIINPSETPTTLNGAFNLSDEDAATNSMAFVQIAMPLGTSFESLRCRGQFTILTPSGYILEDVVFPIPEPSAASLTASCLAALAFARARPLRGANLVRA